jgi:hypothetical protein
MVRVGLAVLAFASAAGACHGSSDGTAADAGSATTDGGATDAPANEAAATPFTEAAMRAAATAFNSKLCEAQARCDPSNFEFYYGTIAECIGAGGLSASASTLYGGIVKYFDDVHAPYAYGSLVTPDSLTACAAALDLSTCQKFVSFFYENRYPEVCRPINYGSLPDGSPCRVFNQCLGGRCLTPANAPAGACGQCFTEVPVGGPCTTYAQCKTLLCTADSDAVSTCKEYRALGQSCDAAHFCDQTLVCTAGTCTTPAADGSCDPAYGCSGSPYLQYCNPTSRKCELVPLGKLGEPCGPVPYIAGQPAWYCEHDATCVQDIVSTDAGTDDGGAPDSGAPVVRYSCKPLIDDGAQCNPPFSIDFPCKRPDSVCYQNTCQQRGPAECSPPPVTP